MKQWIRRGAALGLALALTVTAASASQAMGLSLIHIYWTGPGSWPPGRG